MDRRVDPLVLTSFLSTWATMIPRAFAAPAPSASDAGTLTYQQYEQEGQLSDADQGPFVRPIDDTNALSPSTKTTPNVLAGTVPATHFPGVEPATMQALTYTLDDSFALHRPTTTKAVSALKPVTGLAIPAGATPLDATGSDGRLEVQVPRGSLDFAHATLAGGLAPAAPRCRTSVTMSRIVYVGLAMEARSPQQATGPVELVR